MHKSLKACKRAKVQVPILVLVLLLLSIPLIGVSWWLADTLGMNPFTKKVEDKWEVEGMMVVNRKLDITLTNKFAGSPATSWTVKVYGEDGKTLLESLTSDSSTGIATTNSHYQSGVKLVLEASSGNDKLRKPLTVPRMTPADVDAVTNNPLDVDVFTIPADIIISVMDSAGTSYSDGGSLNKTTFGNTGGLTVMLNLPTDNEGYISSYDEIDGLNWYCVLYAKLYNTNYEYVSLTGWSVQYSKGIAEWFATRLADTDVTKYKVGNVYIHNGASSFTFSIDLTGYSGDVADIEFYVQGYSDWTYHDAKGSFGPDSYAMITSSPFTLNLVD